MLSQTSQVPLYEQIKDQIRAAVYTGDLKPGDALPSLRELARDLQVSLITVTRAYNDLAAEGLIGSRQGKGSVVLPIDAERLRSHVSARIDAALSEAVKAAAIGGLGLEHLHAQLEHVWDSEDTN